MHFPQCCVCLMMMTMMMMNICLAPQGSWDPRWGRRKARPSSWRSGTWPPDHTASTHTAWLTGSSPRVGEVDLGSCGKPAAVKPTGADCSASSRLVLVILLSVGQPNKQDCLSFSKILTNTARLSKQVVLKSNRKCCWASENYSLCWP